jgi:hypothetical protein
MIGNKFWLKISLVIFFAALASPLNPISAKTGHAEVGKSQSPLCLPQQTGPVSENCLLEGPANYLARQESFGILLPRQKLTALSVDSFLSELPFNYIRLLDNETPLFGDLDSAMQNEDPYRIIPPGFKFATYVDYYQGSGKGRHYMIAPGIWVRGSSVAGRVVPSDLTGLVFSRTPEKKFGWVISQVEIQTVPGDKDSLTGNLLGKFDVIQVYSQAEVEGNSWLMIGPDEWIEKSKTALIYPAINPPEGVGDGRWIEINLMEQTVSAYQDGQLVFATVTSTGIPGWWTRPGLFQIYEKLETTPMSGAFEADRSDYYYLEDVPWTMYFDEARALHGTYWHDLFGYERSHGCVNLSPADSRWLFNWADIGDFVYVWDPSGETPTDPSLYSAGGA